MNIRDSFAKILSNAQGLLAARSKTLWFSISFSLMLCAWLQNSGNGEQLENRIGRPALFSIREKLGQAPKLDPRIIIYGYDDHAVYEWGRPEQLSGRTWSEMIKAIADHNPKVILIDMIFGHRRTDPKDISAMNNAFKRKTPVFTAASIKSRELENRPQLELNEPRFTAQASELTFWKKYYSDNNMRTVYGPAENLPQLKKNLGHINFRPPGFVMPIVPMPKEKFLKHLSFASLDPRQIKIDGTNLFVNDEHVPLNGNGELIINWSSVDQYYVNFFKIADLVEIRRDGYLSQKIREDSVVILLPLMFSGNADNKETFVGQLEGGFVHVAVMNSILTGKWLRDIDPGYFGIFIFLLLAWLGALIRKNYGMWIYGIGVNTLFLVVAVLLFVFNGWLIEWINCFLAFNVAFFPVVVMATISSEIRSIRINEVLAGVLPPKMMTMINRDPQAFSIKPVEQTVTVLFVDFVGFSWIAERMSSRAVFQTLKSHLGDLGKIIHKYQGIVDKSLGDGVLGVFGFDPVTRAVSDSHAEDAVLAAIEIQKLIAGECARYFDSQEKSDDVIFTCRIGINTGTVFIGNVGDTERFDLTVIGHVVNLGKRLEEACEPFKVLIGFNTQQYINGPIKHHVSKRLIQIKHHAELIETFEIDPFRDENALYSNALKGYRKFSNISRKEERRIVPPGQAWEIVLGGRVSGNVIDYSRTGLCTNLSQFYGNKVAMDFDLIVKSTGDNRILFELRGLHATVMWGRTSSSVFTHGLAFTPESVEKFSKLFGHPESSKQ